MQTNMKNSHFHCLRCVRTLTRIHTLLARVHTCISHTHTHTHIKMWGVHHWKMGGARGWNYATLHNDYKYWYTYNASWVLSGMQYVCWLQFERLPEVHPYNAYKMAIFFVYYTFMWKPSSFCLGQTLSMIWYQCKVYIFTCVVLSLIPNTQL